LEIPYKSETRRQTRHFRTVDQAIGQYTNNAGALLNFRNGGNVLSSLLKRLTVQKDIIDQSAGILKTRGNTEVVVAPIKEGADVEIVQGEGSGSHVNEATLDAYA
jgi:hypothetical protein